VRDLIITSASKRQNLEDVSSLHTLADLAKIYELKKQCILDIEKIFTIVIHRRPSYVFPSPTRRKIGNFLALAEHVDFNVPSENLDVILDMLSEVKKNIDIALNRQTHHTKTKLLDVLDSVFSQKKPVVKKESIEKSSVVEKPTVTPKETVVEDPQKNVFYQKNLFVLNYYLAHLKKLLHIHNKLIDEKDVEHFSDPARYKHITALTEISPIIEEIGKCLVSKQAISIR
jgi:hypothetical protein